MPVNQAADHLGLSTGSVEGLIQAGELQGRQGADRRSEVLISEDTPAAEAAAAPASPAKEADEIEIGRTALTVAKRLTETHEAELRRARRSLRLSTDRW